MSVEGGKWGFKVGWSTNLEQKYKYHRRRVTDKQSILDEQSRERLDIAKRCLHKLEDDYSTSIPRSRQKNEPRL